MIDQKSELTDQNRLNRRWLVGVNLEKIQNQQFFKEYNHLTNLSFVFFDD